MALYLCLPSLPMYSRMGYVPLVQPTAAVYNLRMFGGDELWQRDIILFVAIQESNLFRVSRDGFFSCDLKKIMFRRRIC